MSSTTPSSTAQLGRRLWRDGLSRHRGLVGLAVLLSAVTAGAAASYVGVVGHVFDTLEAGVEGLDWIGPLAIVGLALLRSASLYLQTVQTNRLALTVMQDLQNAMFAKLVRSDFTRLQNEPVGSLVSRFTNDITLLRETLIRLTNNLLRDILQVIATIGWMLWLDWMLTLLILVVYPVAAWPVIRIGQRLRKTSNKAQSQMGEVTSQLEESFSGTRMVKTYGLEDFETQRAGKAFADRFAFLFRIAENKARVDPILEAVGGLALSILILVAGWRLMQGESSIGDLMGVLTGVALLASPIRAIGTLNAVVQEGFAVLERVFAVLDEPETITTALDAPELKVENGAVAFDQVGFAYPDGTAALESVSLTVEPGQTVALVGPSGSGKSTILNLLPRLYDPQNGTVSIDGQDIRGVSLPSLRRAMALVSQDVTLFDDTVRANIGFGDLDADEAAIIAAAKAADAHDFITKLPGGYDAPVGPRGSNLSGGQRQRLSIARAILKNAPILLLDEATSALDTESERRVQEALEHLSEGRTCLVIAHRLSTVRNADWIYVLENGQIAEQGRHDDLVAEDGLYARLCRMQFGEEG
ncbi:ABC transporter ATP-binding protein [Maricaulis parjimensis]|uniref:ABC transporter ATP-binding protein n=1 Tax=Maricaulis parjimensis TaxID=144023 RepID=UPI0019395A4D|nr:ABC transporter ATP-binding protein [Maricaulis parjimensis]